MHFVYVSLNKHLLLTYVCVSSSDTILLQVIPNTNVFKKD